MVHGAYCVSADHAVHWYQTDGKPTQFPQECSSSIHLPL